LLLFCPMSSCNLHDRNSDRRNIKAGHHQGQRSSVLR
jgi:hypothetical protein